MIENSSSPWLHRIALLTALATFPLIFMGGLVTSHQAGMSVPDWPNSYGYNMFLFPPRLWKGGIFFEHVHRLMGSAVGFCSILLTIVAWKTESRRWVRWLATSVLGAVIFQGVLGGLRVVLVKLDLAIVHACVAQAFFCLATLAAIVTSDWWKNAPDLSRTKVGWAPPTSSGHEQNGGQSPPYALSRIKQATAQPRIIAVAVLCILAIYAQLMVGATMRHYQAGLAIPDLPLAYGKLLPPTTQIELDAINQQRTWNMNLEAVTLPQIWLHFGHRIGAIIVTLAIVILVGTILLKYRSSPDLLAPAWILSTLLIIQICLGVLTVYLRKPADIASAHVAVGALVLVTAFTIAVRSMRLYSLRFRMGSTAHRTFAPDQIPAGLHAVPA